MVKKKTISKGPSADVRETLRKRYERRKTLEKKLAEWKKQFGVELENLESESKEFRKRVYEYYHSQGLSTGVRFSEFLPEKHSKEMQTFLKKITVKREGQKYYVVLMPPSVFERIKEKFNELNIRGASVELLRETEKGERKERKYEIVKAWIPIPAGSEEARKALENTLQWLAQEGLLARLVEAKPLKSRKKRDEDKNKPEPEPPGPGPEPEPPGPEPPGPDNGGGGRSGAAAASGRKVTVVRKYQPLEVPQFFFKLLFILIILAFIYSIIRYALGW